MADLENGGLIMKNKLQRKSCNRAITKETLSCKPGTSTSWILPILLLSLVLVLCQDSVQAAVRDWDGAEIDTIKTNVEDITDKLKSNGDISTVAADLKEQLKIWGPLRDNAELLRDAVEDILEWLGSRRSDYMEFVGDIGNKCNPISQCGILKSDLVTFFQEISDLPPEIEAIRKLGLHDLSVAEKIINIAPAIILFAIHESLGKIQNWQQVPADVLDIFNEIDDPDIFSLKLNDEESSALAITSSVGPLDRTKTQRFCRLRADRLDSDRIFDGVDPIRLNRLQFILTDLKLASNFAAEGLPDDIDASGTLLGEGVGSAVPNPLKPLFLGIAVILETINEAIGTHRENINLCQDRFDELESRIASCTRYAEFTLDIASNEEYYDLLKRRLIVANNGGIPTSKSVEFYNASTTFLKGGSYASAYLKLCEAYQAIERGTTCDPELATDEDNPVACKDQSATEICNDGVDNDGDGDIDCDDRRDCRRDPAC
jgi:hypothetical protein